MATEQATGGGLGDHEVRGAQLPDVEQPADQRVDSGVRRVRDDAEGMPGPPEPPDVQLDHTAFAVALDW